MSQTTPMGDFTFDYDGNSRRILTVYYPNSTYMATYCDYFGNVFDKRVSFIGNRSGVGLLYTHPYCIQVSSFDLSYDVLGRITSMYHGVDDSTFPTPSPGDEYYSFSHDAEGQLLSVNANPASGSIVPTSFAYSYDSAGNRKSEQREVLAAPVSPNNAAPTKVSKSTYNGDNQLSARAGTGSLPVLFNGTVSENSTVTVNSQTA